MKCHIELNRRRAGGDQGESRHTHTLDRNEMPRARERWRWRWTGAWHSRWIPIGGSGRRHCCWGRSRGECAAAATCHHARPPYYVQTAGMAMAWDVCLCLGRRVASCPLSLPASTYVVPLCAMHGHRSAHVDAATDKRVHCLDGNYRLPCACVMTPAPAAASHRPVPRRRPLR